MPGTEPPADGEVRLTVDGAVATITLDRPGARNALTVAMKVALLRTLTTIGRDRSVRAVILTGAGRAFCAGQDLRERRAPDAPPLAIELRERYHPIIRAMRSLPQPIVGAVDGVAAGAGASLAFACDLRIASADASFLLAFGRIGLVPDSGATWFLPRLVGASKAAELALLGDAISAIDAERFGLVARLVPDRELPAAARAMADRLAALSPAALSATKRGLERAWSVDLDRALEDEALRQGVAGGSPDHAEGMAAFLEKRPPRFGED